MAAPLRTGGFFGAGYRRSINEKKTVDVAPNSYVADTTGTVTLLNGIATGTDFTDRIGRKIILKSIFVRGLVGPVDTSTGTNCARILIVYDMQANGSAPAVTDILKTADSRDQINLNNRDRFKILFDKQWTLGPFDGVTLGYIGAPSVANVKLYRRLNLETLFNGTTAAIGSIATGSIYMVTIGNQAAANGSSFQVSTRIRFVDA